MATQKERFNEVIEVLNTVEGTAELVEFIQSRIDLLDKRTSKKGADELMPIVLAGVTEEFSTVADIVARIGREDVTARKVTYRLNQLASGGVVEKGYSRIDKHNYVVYRVA